MEKEGFSKRDVDTFRGLTLSTADDIPLQVRQLWEKYNGGVPERWDARRCWVATPPTDAELLEATIDQIHQSKSDPSLVCSVIHRGDPDEKIGPLRAVAQLAFPDLWNPLKLLDLRLPVVRDGILKLPKGLSANMSEPDNLQTMLTPKYSSSELHFGTVYNLQKWFLGLYTNGMQITPRAVLLYRVRRVKSSLQPLSIAL